jgi:hypothetical protein
LDVRRQSEGMVRKRVKSQRAGRAVVTVEQWVEVMVEDGRTVTRLFPSNAELKNECEERAAELVYRRLHFAGMVPPEYYWTTADAEIRERGGCGIQRMTVATWLRTVAEEAADGSGHVGRCYEPVPRPRERGGCECEVCALG